MFFCNFQFLYEKAIFAPLLHLFISTHIGRKNKMQLLFSQIPPNIRIRLSSIKAEDLKQFPNMMHSIEGDLFKHTQNLEHIKT